MQKCETQEGRQPFASIRFYSLLGAAKYFIMKIYDDSRGKFIDIDKHARALGSRLVFLFLLCFQSLLCVMLQFLSQLRGNRMKPSDASVLLSNARYWWNL